MPSQTVGDAINSDAVSFVILEGEYLDGMLFDLFVMSVQDQMFRSGPGFGSRFIKGTINAIDYLLELVGDLVLDELMAKLGFEKVET